METPVVNPMPESATPHVVVKRTDPVYEKRKHRAIIISSIVIGAIIVVVVTVVMILEFGISKAHPPMPVKSGEPSIDTNGNKSGGNTGGSSSGSSGSSGGTTGGRSGPTPHDPTKKSSINFQRVTGGTLEAKGFGDSYPLPSTNDTDNYVSYNVHFDIDTLTGVYWMESSKMEKLKQRGGLLYRGLATDGVNNPIKFNDSSEHGFVQKAGVRFSSLAVSKEHMDNMQMYIQTDGRECGIYYLGTKPFGVKKLHLVSGGHYMTEVNKYEGGKLTSMIKVGTDYWYIDVGSYTKGYRDFTESGTALVRMRMEPLNNFPTVDTDDFKTITDDTRVNARQLETAGEYAYVYYGGHSGNKSAEVVQYKLDTWTLVKSFQQAHEYEAKVNHPGQFMAVMGDELDTMVVFDGSSSLQCYQSVNGNFDVQLPALNISPFWIGTFDPDHFESVMAYGRFLVVVGREKTDMSKGFALVFTYDNGVFKFSEIPQIIKFSTYGGENTRVGRFVVRDLPKQHTAMIVLPIGDKSLEKFTWDYSQ